MKGFQSAATQKNLIFHAEYTVNVKNYENAPNEIIVNFVWSFEIKSMCFFRKLTQKCMYACKQNRKEMEVEAKKKLE